MTLASTVSYLLLTWLSASTYVLSGYTLVTAVAAVALYYFYRVKDYGFRNLLFWSLITVSVSYVARTFVTETQFIIPLAMLLILESITPTPKKLFGALSAVMAAFLIVHVPISQFLWIGIPGVVAATTAFSNSLFWGSIRWIASTALVYAYTFFVFAGIWKMRHVLAPGSSCERDGVGSDTASLRPSVTN